MKSAVPILVALLLLLLLPAGDIISRETRHVQRPCDVGIDEDPGGDDHPWGGVQSSGSANVRPVRSVPRLATGVWAVDIAYSLPALRSYLTDKFYWLWTENVKRDLPADGDEQENTESHQQSRNGSGRVD